MTRVDEEYAFNDRYLVVEPTLDESAWRLHGRLPGTPAKLSLQRSRRKPTPCRRNRTQVTRAVRNADALWAISLDVLSGGDGATIDTSTPLLTVFMDASEAAPTNAEAGVVIEAGPRVGRSVIEAILCDGMSRSRPAPRTVSHSRWAGGAG